MSRPCRVVQAYDRSLIKAIRADEADALEAKLEVCVSTQQIFVHSDIKAEFVERLATRVRVLRVGDPLLADTEVGPLIVPREVSSWIGEAVAGGRRGGWMPRRS
jgi:acyl-CoA reductase-like NAD-dependent aldehyde dehydrogenase